MSELDGLTRISNHRALVERLKSETERSDQKQTPLAIRYFRH
jgi:PleD family two-component response regulator